MTSSVTIIPANPGFFVAARSSGSPEPEATLDPVIAWRVHTSSAFSFATPITFEEGDRNDGHTAVVRPDGSVFQSDCTFASVAEWLKGAGNE